MEQEHPIPQQISTYEFRLVGDMTLKQFFQVAAGALVALLVYSSGLAGYIKWPIIIISFLLGVAFAFFPLQDRPLATWLVLFFKAIYSPTVYVWKKGAGIRDYFRPEPTAEPPQPTPTEKKGPQETPDKGPEKDFPELERKEKEFLTQVQKQMVQPGLAPKEATKDPEEVREEKQKEVEVPEDQKVKVQREEKVKPSPQQPPPSDVGGEIAPSAGGKLSDAKMAEFSDEAAPPTPPTKPNVVVGQVMDAEGKIVEGAILEIKDEDGRSVRALKTNKAGHFTIVTPLSNGKYQLITEKQDLEFEPLDFEARGEIIPPIAVRAEGKKKAAQEKKEN